MDMASLILFQAVHASTQEEVRRDIESHPVQEIHDVHRLTRTWQFAQEGISPLFEDHKISNFVLDEHGPNQASTILPKLAIGREDAVSKKWAPCLVKLRAFAEVRKFGR